MGCLDRHLPRELRVFRQVDDSHRPFAEGLDDAVAAEIAAQQTLRVPASDGVEAGTNVSWPRSVIERVDSTWVTSIEASCAN